MGHHLTKEKAFKSDKYNWCPEGFFALKLTDSLAQKVILIYAKGTQDKELAEDLRKAITKVNQNFGSSKKSNTCSIN